MKVLSRIIVQCHLSFFSFQRKHASFHSSLTRTRNLCHFTQTIPLNCTTNKIFHHTRKKSSTIIHRASHKWGNYCSKKRSEVEDCAHFCWPSRMVNLESVIYSTGFRRKGLENVPKRKPFLHSPHYHVLAISYAAFHTKEHLPNGTPQRTWPVIYTTICKHRS